MISAAVLPKTGVEILDCDSTTYDALVKLNETLKLLCRMGFWQTAIMERIQETLQCESWADKLEEHGLFGEEQIQKSELESN
jgi:hypothetical protein